MKKIRLGCSDLYVSRLGLGCINFGTLTDEKTAFDIIDGYLEKDGNMLDTANNYAIWNGGDGRSSERTIGKWIKNNPGRREEFVLATKLGALSKNAGAGFDDMQGTDRKTIIEETEKSLHTMNIDHIDLLYLHVDDFQTPQEETMSALTEVNKKGCVKNIGCSNFRTWRIERARQICSENDYPFFCAVQQRYSYFQPVADADFGVQIAADNELKNYIGFYKDITLVSHTSLLHGAYFKENIEDSLYDTKQNREQLQKLKTMKNPAAWVLKYITEQYGGCVVLFTTNSREHLSANMGIYDDELRPKSNC